MEGTRLWLMFHLQCYLNFLFSFRFANATRVPTSKAMEKARLETFTMFQSWAHDEVQGHGANSGQVFGHGIACLITLSHCYLLRWRRLALSPLLNRTATIRPLASIVVLHSVDGSLMMIQCALRSETHWRCSSQLYRAEHRKREKRIQTVCPFLAASSASLSKSTSKAPSRASSKAPSRVPSQSKVKSAIVTDPESAEEGSDDQEPPPPPTKAAGSSRSKKTAAAASSSAPSTSTSEGTSTASRRVTRSKGAKSSVTEASEEELEVMDGSETEAGKKVSRSKRKGKAVGKPQMESVREQVEEEEEPEEIEPAKPKRGRTASSKKTGATSTSRKKKVANENNEADDVDTETTAPPPKTKPTRTRSKANLQSDAEASHQESTRSQSKSKSSTKSHRTPASELEEDTAEQSAPVRKKTKAPTPDVEPVAADSKPAKGRTVSRSKPKPKVVQSDSDDEDVSTPHEQPPAQKSRSTSRTASTSRTKPEKVIDPPSRSEKSATKTRKSSSTSDDAGYATAELPMDVDDTNHATHALEQDEDAVMADSHDQDSGLADSVAPSSPPPSKSSDRKPSSQSSRKGVQTEDLPSRSSNTRGQAVPKSSSSSALLLDEPGHASAHGKINDTKSKKGKDKMQVEVVISTSGTRKVSAPLVADMDTENDEMVVDGIEQHSESAATPPPATSSSSPPRPTDPSTPKSRNVQFLPSVPEAETEPSAPSDSEIPVSIIPLLSVVPLERLTALTEEESAMTIEQYIRREIDVQYQRFKEDGERRITLFKEKAAETRRIIEAS